MYFQVAFMAAPSLGWASFARHAFEANSFHWHDSQSCVSADSFRTTFLFFLRFATREKYFWNFCFLISVSNRRIIVLTRS